MLTLDMDHGSKNILDELDIFDNGKLIDTIEYDYPEFHLSKDCFWCEIIKGKLVLKEHEAARWLTRNQLADVKLRKLKNSKWIFAI